MAEETTKATAEEKPKKSTRRSNARNEKKLAKKTAEKLNMEEKVIISVSPQYEKEFGRNMPVSINGVAIYVPCDGQDYKVPKTYAKLIKQRVRAVDAKIKKTRRMADVSKNFERTPGELKLFR